MLNPPAGVKLAMEAVCTMIYDVKKVFFFFLEGVLGLGFRV